MSSVRLGRSVVAAAGAAALVVSLTGLVPAVAGATAGQHGAGPVGSVAVEVAEWSSTAAYDGGDQVTYDGSLWRAGWWTRGQAPGDPNGPWQELVTTPDGQVVWTPSRAFDAGDVVLHRGTLYVSHWYTRNQDPTDPNGPWRVKQPHAPTPGEPTDWSSALDYDTGALVRHDGHLWQAQWWAGRQEPGALDGPWGELAFTGDGAVIWTPTRAFSTGDEVTFQGVRYVAKWWTRNQVPGDPHGPWGITGDEPAAGALRWSPETVFVAGDVVAHGGGRYVAREANRSAEPGDPAGPWLVIPDSVSVTERPGIAGTARVARTVRARTGRWDDAAVTFRYQWFTGRRPLAGAEGRTFRIPASARGRLLRVVVTAHRSGAPVGSAASAPVRVRPRGR